LSRTNAHDARRSARAIFGNSRVTCIAFALREAARGETRPKHDKKENRKMTSILNDTVGLMKLSEAAKFLRKSESGVRKWLADGTLPPNTYTQPKPRGRIYFLPAALEKWLRERV
jgi:hypothetical protein